MTAQKQTQAEIGFAYLLSVSAAAPARIAVEDGIGVGEIKLNAKKRGNAFLNEFFRDRMNLFDSLREEQQKDMLAEISSQIDESSVFVDKFGNEIRGRRGAALKTAFFLRFALTAIEETKDRQAGIILKEFLLADMIASARLFVIEAIADHEKALSPEGPIAEKARQTYRKIAKETEVETTNH